MSNPTPRELLAVLVHTDTNGITATFHLGEEIDPVVGAEWFTYGLSVSGSDGATIKHFVARLSLTERKALVFDFESSTQANYDASHVDVHETFVVARFLDASLGLNWDGSLTGFSTIEGDDVTVEAPVQVLSA
jgi:hypothetical protein